MRPVELTLCLVGVATVVLSLALSGPVASEAAAGMAGQQAVPDPTVPTRVPDSARRLVNPVRADARSIERGETIFQSQCTMCHGVLGSGKGDLVERLGLKMPDFTDSAARTRRADGELFWIIRNGHGQMPTQAGRFDDETWWNVVNYIRTLARED